MWSYLIKNSSWVFLANFILALLAFLTTTILAHLLPKETFGSYRYVMTIIPLLAVFTLPDIGQAITRAVAKKFPLNLNKIILEKITFGLWGSLLALLFAGYYFYSGNGELTKLFIITAIFIPFYDVFLIYITAFYGLKLFSKSSSYQVINRLVSTLSLILVIIFTNNIYLVLITYFLTQIIPQLFFFQYSKKHFFNSPLFNSKEKSETKKVSSYGKDLTLIGTLSTFAASLDKLLVWHFFDAKTLAIYTVATLIAWEGGRMINSLSTVILPFLSEATSKDSVKKLFQITPIIFIILSAGAFIGYLLIPYVFPYIFPNYPEAIFLASISLCLITINPINALFYQFLVAETYVKKMSILQILKIISIFICFIFSYKTLGMTAGLLSLIVGEIITLIYLIIVIRYNIKDLK